MADNTVLIIGGGAAGLAAARELTAAGAVVRLIEARDRLGGRIHTVPGHRPGLPIELGAEFVHGERNDTWEFIRLAGLRVQEVPDRHLVASNGTLKRDARFWEELAGVFARINTATPDQDFQSFLDQAWGLSSQAKKLAKQYVEGFHAAPANRISIHALARSESAAERDNAIRQFRLADGYAALVRWFERELSSQTVEIRLNNVVQQVSWEPGQVQVQAQTPAGRRSLQGARLLITLPLGVWRHEGPGAIVFDPALPAKEKALRSLAISPVVKLALEFSERCWPTDNFGFVHSDQGWFPTWWSDERAPILTGWAGGPRAEQVRLEGVEAATVEALRSLSRIFKIEYGRLKDGLVASYSYDWQTDPFARGAYTYTPARMIGAAARLAAPLANTLFFAGEATDTEGEQGTVHAALASGGRAAREILKSLHLSHGVEALAISKP